jgi:hypothetical protein
MGENRRMNQLSLGGIIAVTQMKGSKEKHVSWDTPAYSGDSSCTFLDKHGKGSL